MASLAFQILLATLAPMAVGRWVWEEWMASRVGKANSTLHYAITHRLLPIILVAFTMKLGEHEREHKKRLRDHSRSIIANPLTKISTLITVFIAFTKMPTSANNVNATSPDDESEESSLMERMATDRIKYAAENSHHHEMEFGRPNIADAITKEIEEARSIGRTSLVVAACGPNALVSAARSAFEVVSKNNRNKGFEMQFTGSESQW